MIRTATCPLCEASCGILVETDGQRILSIRGDTDDPFSRGYICPKAAALPDLHDDPDRLRVPVIRDGSEWREASWDEAFDRAADGLSRVRREHGRDAVAIYYGNPVAHNLGLMTHALPFARMLRTRNVYSASSADQLPQMLAAYRMYGHLALIPVPDVDRTDYLLIIGANPMVSNGSLMTAPNMPARLRAIRARGGRILVIDPRRTETAKVADEHLAIRPGADALLVAATLQVIFEEHRDRLGRLGPYIASLPAIRHLVGAFPPERVANRTGIEPEVIRRIARDFANTPRAACYGRVGMCQQRHGTLASWLVQVLNLVTAHVDEVGCMMLTTPAVDAVRVMSRLRMRGSFDRWRSRARQLPEFSGDPPIATLADEIETPGTGQVRGLITIAGNPVLSAPNGKRLDAALGSLEHMVAIDGYINETTRHARVILPPAPPLSRGHYDLALYAFSVRNVAKYSAPVIPRAASERDDWEIVTELASRLFVWPVFRRVARSAALAFTPERLVDLLLRAGPHPLTLSKLRQCSHGLDLGALQPGRIAALLEMERRSIDIAPDDFVREARAQLLPEVDSEREEAALVLIGRRQLRDNNSWMHNSHRLVKGPERCTLLMHPSDAQRRRLKTGDLARLASEVGAIVVAMEVTDDVRPGVVSLPHGWGHDRDGVRLTIARGSGGAAELSPSPTASADHHSLGGGGQVGPMSAGPGMSVNDITDDRHLDTLSGNAAFNGLTVVVSPLQRVGAERGKTAEIRRGSNGSSRGA